LLTFALTTRRNIVQSTRDSANHVPATLGDATAFATMK
jgi:hypothetical protein